MDERARISVRMLAERLHISAQAIRGWISRGLIAPPTALPGSRGSERGYSVDQAAHIEQWYAKRCAAGLTHGVGSEARRARAAAWLARTAAPGQPNETVSGAEPPAAPPGFAAGVASQHWGAPSGGRAA